MNSTDTYNVKACHSMDKLFHCARIPELDVKKICAC